MKSRERKAAKRLYGPTVQYADGTVDGLTAAY